jgi:nucleotide-binding universal stress UspA family protein
MPQRILVGTVAGDAARDAMTLGLQLARRCQTSISLISVDTDDRRLERRSNSMAALDALRHMAPDGVDVTTQAITAASVPDALHDLAVDHHADLIVLGPTRRPLVEQLLQADVAGRLPFRAPCAVAVATRAQPPRPPRRIGVAWNATPKSQTALEWAVQLAENSDAELRITRVVAPRGRGYRAMLELEALCCRTAERATTDGRVVWDHVGPAIIRASDDVDLMVLGARTDHGHHAPLGPISRQVLHDTRCATVMLPERADV